MAVSITNSGGFDDSNTGFSIGDLGSAGLVATRSSDNQSTRFLIRTSDFLQFPLFGDSWNTSNSQSLRSPDSTASPISNDANFPIRHYETRVVLVGNQTITISDMFRISEFYPAVEYFYFECLATYYATSNIYSQAYSTTLLGAWKRDSAGYTAQSVRTLTAFDIVTNSALDVNNIVFNGGGATVPSVTFERSDTAVASGGRTIWNISGFSIISQEA